MLPFWDTCRILSESLCEAAIRFSIASLHMFEVSGQGTPDLFAAAKLETQSVRGECEEIRAQFDHRAENQASEKSKTAGSSGN